MIWQSIASNIILPKAAVAYKEHVEILDQNLKLREEVQFMKKRFYRLDAKAKKKFSPAYEDILNPVYQKPIRALIYQ